jgi:hypothetical protein
MILHFAVVIVERAKASHVTLSVDRIALLLSEQDTEIQQSMITAAA